MSLMAAMLIGFTALSASSTERTTEIAHGKLKTEKFKVYGNCGMCKKTIEGAFKDVKGVDKAVWDAKTKMMSVTFDDHIISLADVKKKIAAVGYDTDEFKASKESYGKLASCCQYDREEAEEEEEEELEIEEED